MTVFSSLIEADQDELFSVLIGYERYPSWTADVVSASVLVREGDIVVAEFSSPELARGNHVLEFVHAVPDSIVYRQVDQYGERGLQGSWQLERVDDQSIRLTGKMQLKTTLWAARSNAIRAALILRRRLDLLERMFNGRASRCPVSVYY